MSTQDLRACVFKRCPDTEYMPRKSLCTPTGIFALDLSDWAGVASLERAMLQGLSYLHSSVQSVSYHLVGEDCSLQRLLEELFNDAVQHCPKRRGKGVLLHLNLEGREAIDDYSKKTAEPKATPQKDMLELSIHEGEHFDAT